MSWEDCKKKRIVKHVSVDLDLINSLKITSKNKEISASMLKFDKRTYSSIVSLYYDSLRELLEAVVLSKGFKIYNHECYVYFISTILGDREFSYNFDAVRKIRNGLNYYGESLDLKDAEIVIADLKKLIAKARGFL